MTAFIQAVKKGALLIEHLVAGLWLDEGDHGLTLVHTNPDGPRTKIAHWGMYADMWEIQRKATEWLERNKNACR